MTTPDRIQPGSSFDAAMQRADEIEARYGEACDRRDAARNPLVRVASGITATICKVDLRTTERLAVVELQREQFADGAVPMVED